MRTATAAWLPEHYTKFPWMNVIKKLFPTKDVSTSAFSNYIDVLQITGVVAIVVLSMIH